MGRQKIEYTQRFSAVMRAMTGRGLLVGSYDAAGKANLMTIGWGSLGSIWGLPMWVILVRPSRYTYRCIEHSGCFTVNVPTEDMSMTCASCGSKSGRDIDKFEQCNLTVRKSSSVLAPGVEQCPIIYECQVVHSNDVQPDKLSDRILSGAYVDGDFHRIYYGKIIEIAADQEALSLLKE